MLKIREATHQDVEVVYELIVALARHHNQESYVLTTKDQLAQAGFGQNT